VFYIQIPDIKYCTHKNLNKIHTALTNDGDRATEICARTLPAKEHHITLTNTWIKFQCTNFLNAGGNVRTQIYNLRETLHSTHKNLEYRIVDYTHVH